MTPKYCRSHCPIDLPSRLSHLCIASDCIGYEQADRGVPMYTVSAAAPAREPLNPAGSRDLADSLVELLDTAGRKIERDSEAAKVLIARALSLLQIEVERSAATTRRDTASGGLAAWQ